MKTTRIALGIAALALAFAAPMARAAEKAPAAKARSVELTLTDSGLAPAEVTLTKGEPVHLAITRKTDKTCMTEVVIADVGVRQALPLNKTVYADFTPTKTGTLKVLCGMGMAFGKLVVN
jgi:plastocyanin domain-containing protein